MDPLSRLFRRRKNVSREERAEKYSKGIALRHEFSQGITPRLTLALVFVLVGVVLLPPTKRTQEIAFRAGEIADRDVIAPFNFRVPLSQEELRIRQAQASLKVPPVYRRLPNVETDLTNDLAALMDTLTVIVNIDTLDVAGKTNRLSSWLPNLPAATLDEIAQPSVLRALNKASKDFQRNVFTRGLVDNASIIRRNGYTEISVVDNQNETLRKVSDIIDQGNLDRLIREEATARFGTNQDRTRVFFEVVRGHLLPNLQFDYEETNVRRDAATNQVIDYFEVSKNERIIGKHDKVTDDQEQILLALEEFRADQESEKTPLLMVSLYLAEIIRLLLFCLLFAAYLYGFHRDIYRNLGQLGCVFAVMLLYLVFIGIVERFQFNPFIIPAAFVSIMLTALFEYRVGLVAGLFAGALIPLVTNYDVNISFVSMLAATAGVFGVERMRARSHVYAILIHVAAAYLLGVLGVQLGTAESLDELYRSSVWGLGNGVFSAMTVMFLLPIFESLFNRTSRFTLLELTDLNKPLLKRLNMEAHGTYHHSMLIGNLVDAAAEAIGADSLKARVMAYYHDIGKMFKPEYFAENQEGGFNKHEKITPQMSALILVSHVKDGVELAREEKLPQIIIDAIREHHGTSVMAFFYQKALETDSHSSVKKDDFRYPGPRPQTKESGLLMCGDSVEAAVRSLRDPTPVHVRNMVTKLIDARVQEGELDESGLTLDDIHTVKEKFISILSGIYHKRIAYPGQDKKDEPSGEAVAKSVQ